MKSSALLGALLAAATGVTARCVKPSGLPACRAGKCLQALTHEDLGKDFCSVFLSLPPVPSTTTVTTATETLTTVTSTQTDLTTTVETATTIETVTTAASTSYVFQRRDIENPGATRILSACATKAARISSACSCLLSITVPVAAPTTTVLATATTVLSLATTTVSTETETTLTTATTTTSDLAVATIPSNPILNGNFASYRKDRNILPWTNTTAENRAPPMQFYVATICAIDNQSYCNTGDVAAVYPPARVDGFVELVQTFRAKPNTQYSLDFLHRCFVASTTARIEVIYNGVTRGSSVCPVQSAGFMWPRNRFFFTTDGTGVGELRLKFHNGQANFQEMYHYIAEIRAVVSTGPV